MYILNKIHVDRGIIIARVTDVQWSIFAHYESNMDFVYKHLRRCSNVSHVAYDEHMLSIRWRDVQQEQCDIFIVHNNRFINLGDI